MGVLAVVILLGAVLLAVRSVLPLGEVPIEPIQVVGDVPEPGWYLLESLTLHQAVSAAGGDPAPWPDLPLLPGWRVVLEDGEVRLEPSGKELVFGLPLDLNRSDVAALQVLPGLGAVLANAVVAHREEHGPFLSVEDLLDVPGIGPARLEALRPFVAVSP